MSELTSIKESGVINFAKVRASIAQAGNDSDPYRLSDVYNPITPNFGSNPLYSVPNSQQNPDLVNELTTEVEFGFLVKLFQNRLTIDAAYYDRTTEDQIFNVPVSSTTGYTSKLLNAGKMKNSGLELEINGKLYSEYIGIRIEDTLLITKKGCKNLTEKCPKSITDIEKLMKN